MKADNPNVSKDKIKLIISAFEELYINKASDSHDNYYIGNFISTGIFEGSYEKIIGTVAGAVSRTKAFIDNNEQLHSSQCEYFSRNLLVILEKESFTQPVEKILMPYLNVMSDIGNGYI